MSKIDDKHKDYLIRHFLSDVTPPLIIEKRSKATEKYRAERDFIKNTPEELHRELFLIKIQNEKSDR